ncbi:type II toxin-antitoxin system HicB family antitoxin [Lactobacillus sp. ESL0791]|uniref:type II toxin-antitoxin system HicB family antitoxin n=1 Tax=Lactobacillus sp. ESL0791 TaxID=2983234 RepID=UPI0023F94504|nr:type II toxin-antitoxin system HicB family antitoxin [Lactobacillus sp. ESL0791]MDF7638173.1 type II toxin-antitoxin system HicB family antitoxin [Lactobacillus sp. ESL0791]
MSYKYFGTLAHNIADDVWEVSFADFPEVITFGSTPAEAYNYGKDALILALDGKTNFPKPSAFKKRVNFDTEKYDEAFQLPFEVTRTEIVSTVKHEKVRKNITIPKYLADEADKHDINYSQFMATALKQKLHI